MKAYAVPWGIPLLTHPLHQLCAPQSQTRRLVSKHYRFISDPRTSLPVESVWNRDLTSVGEEEICWNTIWENLHDTSKNPDHQLIHYKFLHRMYLTPRKRHTMKIITSPNCDLCTLNAVSSFIHMYCLLSGNKSLLPWVTCLKSLSQFVMATMGQLLFMQERSDVFTPESYLYLSSKLSKFKPICIRIAHRRYKHRLNLGCWWGHASFLA